MQTLPIKSGGPQGKTEKNLFLIAVNQLDPIPIFLSIPTISVTFNPHKTCRWDSKHQQEQDEHKCLQVVGCNSLYTKQNGAQKLPLNKNKLSLH